MRRSPAMITHGNEVSVLTYLEPHTFRFGGHLTKCTHAKILTGLVSASRPAPNLDHRLSAARRLFPISLKHIWLGISELAVHALQEE